MAATPSSFRPGAALPVTAAVTAVLALAWSGVLDRPSEAYLDAALLGAGAIYATARAINGLVSVLQGTEFSIPMLSFTIGEFLDPVNDLVERFSAVMMLALGSLALQKVLLALVTDRLFNLMLTVVGIAAAVASAGGPAALRRGLLLAFTLFAAARLALVLAALAAGWTDQLFLAGEERARHAQMQDFRGELEQVGRSAGVSLEDGAEGEQSGLGDRLRGMGELRPQLAALGERVDAFASNLITLLAALLLKTVLLPLLFLYALLRLVRRAFTARVPLPRQGA
ncbi:hypothetical protein [Pseudohaliea sp.]|uniref:hypothetical protein n=1 Tax=Pseudohaliea sp. TaxID=2740289 RepID=UPI0032EACCA5